MPLGVLPAGDGKGGMNNKPNYGGMTVDERLRAAGILETWERALISRDRERTIELLVAVDLSERAEVISDTVLANPGRFRSK